MSEAAPTYPVETIAKLLCITVRRVQQLTKDGVIPRARHGQYELAPAVQGYVRFLQDRQMKRGNGEDDRTMAEEKLRKMKADADIAELDAAVKAGQLHHVDKIRETFGRMHASFRAKILAIPGKAAAGTAALDDIPEIEGILRAMIHEALQELSEYEDAKHQQH